MREITIFCMDTVMTLRAWGPNAETGLENVEKELNRLSELWDADGENSEIAAVNKTGNAEISEDTESLLRFALECGDRTNGALDITVYPLMRLWGFVDKQYRVPNEEEIQAVLQYTGYEKVTLNAGSVSLPAGMALDLGAVAKGWAGDRALEILRKAGVEHACLTLGGSVHCLGGKTEGGAFTVGIQKPQNGSSEIVATIELSDGGAVTSGAYQRFFERDGVVYHHILDPKTGRPAESGLQSVTIFCESGVLADALSTALFVLGEEGIAQQYEQYGDFEAFYVRSDGSFGWTAGLEGKIKLS